MIGSGISLAYSVYRNKGVYALLLGSGISCNAGIPTGWHITLDLIRTVARLQGTDAGRDPVSWLRETYAVDPDYSRLLDILAHSPSERRSILAGYIEPTEADRAKGKKVPTPAHRAIAAMVARGYFRVVITTNFDRLLEQALNDVGVEANVVSAPDNLKGSVPLPHTLCTILKIHGDYQDTRILNTPAELEKYHRDMARFLGRIFEDFGLIVCGWSAQWDTALRENLLRNFSARYSLWWATIEELNPGAAEIVRRFDGSVCPTLGADHFFDDLNEKLLSLEEIRHEELTRDVVVAAAKRYVVDDSARVRLTELVDEVLDDALARVPDNLTDPRTRLSASEFRRRVEAYEDLVSLLAPLAAVLARWGDRTVRAHLRIVLDRLMGLDLPYSHAGASTAWLDLRKYPAMFVFYAAGLSALHGRKFGTLRMLLQRQYPHRQEFRGDVVALTPFRVAERRNQQMLPGLENHRAPFSERLHNNLSAKGVLPFRLTPREFDYLFDQFEVLIALTALDRDPRFDLSTQCDSMVLLGRYALRPCYNPADAFLRDLDTYEEDWILKRFDFFRHDVPGLRVLFNWFIAFCDRARSM